MNLGERDTIKKNKKKGEKQLKECLNYQSGRYSSFCLKPKLQKMVTRKKEALEVEVERKYTKKYAVLDTNMNNGR